MFLAAAALMCTGALIVLRLCLFPPAEPTQPEPPPSGASPARITALPTHIAEVLVAAAAATCPVCLCDYVTGDTLRTLPCGHAFHSSCIDKWLPLSKLCPVCKQDIDAT
eukprot:TRINITY_DN27_c3_g1_i3.p1 TRINITY_DN27_c3_g1~~TRINITY_DN27_c3_g1_i3.p1  ORF type:complete len:109 (-),score=24.24 TRINITY_DN27_c3_g1_i3:121-447(-)